MDALSQVLGAGVGVEPDAVQTTVVVVAERGDVDPDLGGWFALGRALGP